MTIIGWRAWYVGGGVFDSSTTLWEDLPDDGLAVVMLYMDEVNPSNGKHLKRIMQGDDHYFNVGDVYAHSSFTTPQEIIERYPGASIKKGMWMADQEMHDITVLAFAETDPP